jgi:hypothetical protein
MAAVAAATGVEYSDLSEPGFRVTKDSADRLTGRLQDEQKNTTKRTIVIFYLYDNSVFFSAQDDGSRSLPIRSRIDNKYHVPGELGFADHNVLKTLVNNSINLLRAAGENEKIILSPLPRYLIPCCEDDQHLINMQDRNMYFRKMGEAIGSMKESLRDLIFGKKLRSFKVLSPLVILMDGDGDVPSADKLKQLWDKDPVHLVQQEYQNLVSGLLDHIQEGTAARPPRTAGESKAAAARQALFKRKEWVNKDDTLAHRDYGGWRGSGPSRWHRGGPNRPYGRGSASLRRGGGGGPRRGGRGGRQKYRPY